MSYLSFDERVHFMARQIFCKRQYCPFGDRLFGNGHILLNYIYSILRL